MLAESWGLAKGHKSLCKILSILTELKWNPDLLGTSPTFYPTSLHLLL